MREQINLIEGLTEGDFHANVTEYNRKLLASDYMVTESEYISHRHMLDQVAPIVTAMSEANGMLYSGQFINNDESKRMMAMIDTLKSLCVPIALLKIKEKPKGLSLPR